MEGWEWELKTDDSDIIEADMSPPLLSSELGVLMSREDCEKMLISGLVRIEMTKKAANESDSESDNVTRRGGATLLGPA